jgi:hypothetical protein
MLQLHATVTAYLPWPPWAARQNNRIISIFCGATQDGQGKYSSAYHVTVKFRCL